MRKNTYIGIAFIVLIFGIIFIPKIFRRLSNNDVTRGGRMHAVGGVTDAPDQGELAYVTLNGKDRKVPPFSFLNQDRDTISNTNFRGKVYLVEFFFTRCTDICIPMNHNLQHIAKKFENNPNFGIASFSIDPEHDQPEVLKQYAQDYQVTNPNWHFMTGDRETIYKLSNEGFYLNVQYDAGLENGFYHSGLFALIDQNGFIRTRLDPYGNPKPYYRGSVPMDAIVAEGAEQPEIDIVIEDIHKLLNN